MTSLVLNFGLNRQPSQARAGWLGGMAGWLGHQEIGKKWAEKRHLGPLSPTPRSRTDNTHTSCRSRAPETCPFVCPARHEASTGTGLFVQDQVQSAEAGRSSRGLLLLRGWVGRVTGTLHGRPSARVVCAQSVEGSQDVMFGIVWG